MAEDRPQGWLIQWLNDVIEPPGSFCVSVVPPHCGPHLQTNRKVASHPMWQDSQEDKGLLPSGTLLGVKNFINNKVLNQLSFTKHEPELGHVTSPYPITGKGNGILEPHLVMGVESAFPHLHACVGASGFLDTIVVLGRKKGGTGCWGDNLR